MIRTFETVWADEIEHITEKLGELACGSQCEMGCWGEDKCIPEWRELATEIIKFILSTKEDKVV